MNLFHLVPMYLRKTLQLVGHPYGGKVFLLKEKHANGLMLMGSDTVLKVNPNSP